MDWNDVRYFLYVARTGSLTRTASDLHVSQSTVSRRISELEASLGSKLFTRHQTGYVLTDEGQELLRRAQSVEDGMLAFERQAMGLGGTVSGKVRLATSENLAADVVIPALPAFVARYPNLRLEIVTHTAAFELGRHDADLALRVIRPLSGNVKISRVGVMTYSVYATHEYLHQNPPTSESPLAGRAFITWDEAHSHLPAAQWFSQHGQGANVVMATSSLPTQIAAVRAGLGLAVLPDFLVTGESLVKVLNSTAVISNDVWVVVHADLTGSARVRAVADFIAQTVADLMRSQADA